jgi:UDP-glucose 4-epimerase
LVSALLKRGFAVRVLEKPGVNIKHLPNVDLEIVWADITKRDSLTKAISGCSVVFHLAAESRLQPAILNPIEAVTKNAVGTCTILQCAREAGVKKVIYSSTSSAYGMNKYPNYETDPNDCLNPYSVSKVAGEKICKMYNDLYGLKTIFFRYFNVYGERQPLIGQYAPVVGLFLEQKKKCEPLTIVGDGEQRRDFTHVSDVVQANILAATKDIDDEFYGELYNVGNGINYSINEIANAISENQINIPARIGESRTTLANNGKLRTIFGWRPQVNLMDWIKTQ